MHVLYPFLRPPSPYVDIDIWRRFLDGAVYIGIVLTLCGAVAFTIVQWRRDRTSPSPTWWMAAIPVVRTGAAPLITGAVAGGICEAWWREVCGMACVSIGTIGIISSWIALWTFLLGAAVYALCLLIARGSA